MPNWMAELADACRGMTEHDIASKTLQYLTSIGRGPAFLAWLRAEKDRVKHAGG